jgi:twitching motility protein PilT
MQTFNQSLASLLSRRVITQDEAFGRSSDADELKNIIASGAAAGVLPGHTAPPVTGRPMPSRT